MYSQYCALELVLVSNETSGNSTFYRGINQFLNTSIIEEITVFYERPLSIKMPCTD